MSRTPTDNADDFPKELEESNKEPSGRNQAMPAPALMPCTMALWTAVGEMYA